MTVCEPYYSVPTADILRYTFLFVVSRAFNSHGLGYKIRVTPILRLMYHLPYGVGIPAGRCKK